MKTMKSNVCGKKDPVCLNARVLVAGEERFGSLEKFDAAAFSPDIAFADFIWLLATMLDAGYKVAKREGEEPEKPPTEEDLLDIIGLDDMPKIRHSMMKAQVVDTERKVELETPKNEQTTQQSE